MSNIKFTMKDLDGTVMPYTSFVISTSTSANAASFTTNLNGEATVTLAAVSAPYYISKQDGTTESVIAYKFFVPDTTYTLDAELLFVDMGKISKDKNDKSIAALIEAKVVAVNAANRALQVVSLLGDVSTIRDNLTNLVQVASNLTNINAVNANAANINTVAGNTTNINKVATIDTNVTTVANSQTSVNTLATNIANVNTVAPHTANIGTVATNIGSVTTVSGSIASVNTTASNIANVNTVAGNTSNISTVAGISPAVTTVANNIADIQTTAEGIGLIPDVLPYTSNITTVANNIAPIIAVGNNINNINEVRAMEADIEVLADEIANIAGAAAAVTQAVDAQKVLYVAGTDYTKNTSNTLTLPYFPAKSNSVKIFFDGTYKNKDTWNRVGKNIAFTTAINADKVEIQYEVPSSFVGLSPEDILVIQNAEAAAQASEVDAQQSATAAAVSASLAQGVANQAVDAIKQLFVACTGFTKGVSTQLTMDFLPVKTNAVKVFFDGIYQNKNTFTRLGKIITFNEAINVDNVEIHYEVPSQFVGLDDDDNAILVAAQNAAQASANAAAASFDSFDDRYLGAKTVAPTLNNDSNPLLVGTKYFNSTDNGMYVRNSSNAWQLDTADSSNVNYLPAGTGAVATTVQSKLRESVSVKDFGILGDGSDETDKVQAAIDATPEGGVCLLNFAGTIAINPKAPTYVQTTNGKRRYALRINKRITLLGSPACLLKIKSFCDGWNSFVSGDDIDAIIVTASFAIVTGVTIDCNGSNHYETASDGYIYFETGPLLKRPPNGITVIPGEVGTSIRDVRIENNTIIDCLAGVTLSGNMQTNKESEFVSGALSFGVNIGSVSRFNRIERARGNSTLFMGGAISCRAENDKAINNMYHAVRFYFMCLNCEAYGCVEDIDANDVIAKYNGTDKGYWRTNDTASAKYKIQRMGFSCGSAWNYATATKTHNIIGCGFVNVKGTFKRLVSSHSTYYYDATSDLHYLSCVSSLSCPPDFYIRGVRSKGHVYAIGIISELQAIIDGNAGSVSIHDIAGYDNLYQGAVIARIKNPHISGMSFYDLGSASPYAYAVTLSDCIGPVVSNVSVSQLTKTSAVGGVVMIGTTYSSGGGYVSDIVVPIAGNSLPAVANATTNIVVFEGYSYTPTLTNGWVVIDTAVIGGRSPVVSKVFGVGPKTVRLTLTINGTSAVSNSVLTLPAELRPIVAEAFIAIDLVTGKTRFGRILTSGEVQIFVDGVYTQATSVMVDITYSVK